MSISIGQKDVLSSVPSASCDKQQFIEINGKTPEELRQILIELINNNFVDENGTFNTAQQYIEKISNLIPGLLDSIKENKVDISLHATDALTRGDDALAQVLFEFGADRTKVAATLAFAGECIEQVKQLLEQGADPINTLAPLVLAVDGGWADSQEAIPLLSKHLFAKESHFNEMAVGAAEAHNFIDAILIYSMQHGQIEFADKLFPHANDKKRILEKSSEHLQTLCTEVQDSIRQERNVFTAKQGVVQAKLAAIFKIFAIIANWFASLSTRDPHELSHLLKIDVEEIALIDLTA